MAHSRKSQRKQKSRRSRRNLRRTRRGGAMLAGAPLAYSLADDWSSKMSNGQGGDYLKYHVGQHGGFVEGAPLSAITGSGLDSALRASAHVGGLDKAFSDVAGLKDQAGGRRRSRRSRRSQKKGGKRTKKGGKRTKKQGGRRRKNRSRKSKGGALNYAPFSGPSMLLDSAGYQKAGLHPDYVSGGVEREMAQVREAM